MNRFIRISGGGIICIAAFGILMVSLMAFTNPQSIMDLVHVKLPNNDAYSSIRGVYGGAGMTIVIALLYLLIKNQPLGLAFVAVLCGFYSISRVLTIFSEGNLGSFGIMWMKIEASMCVVAIILFYLRKRTVEN